MYEYHWEQNLDSLKEEALATGYAEWIINGWVMKIHYVRSCYVLNARLYRPRDETVQPTQAETEILNLMVAKLGVSCLRTGPYEWVLKK